MIMMTITSMRAAALALVLESMPHCCTRYCHSHLSSHRCIHCHSYCSSRHCSGRRCSSRRCSSRRCSSRRCCCAMTAAAITADSACSCCRRRWSCSRSSSCVGLCCSRWQNQFQQCAVWQAIKLFYFYKINFNSVWWQNQFYPPSSAC